MKITCYPHREQGTFISRLHKSFTAGLKSGPCCG